MNQGGDDAQQTGGLSVSKPGRVVFLDDIAYNTCVRLELIEVNVHLSQLIGDALDGKPS